jgi:glycosyltransferase involved in cell wall biosynthesis
MFLGSCRALRRLHADVGFDVIDAHYVYPDGLAAVLAGRMLDLPVVVSARGTDMNLFPRFKLIGRQIRWTLRRAAGGIGVCSPLRDAMVQAGLDTDHAAVIGNGIDLRRFEPMPRAEARKQLVIPPAARVLVAVGALIPRKGFHLLIPAFARVTRQIPDSVLYIVGEGAQRRELEQLVVALGLQGKVFLPGQVPNNQLRCWYSAADVSCLVSSREGWPNVLLESLACGTPVVATSVWGVPEVISSPALGILVPQDIAAIADGLARALETRWERDVLIARARSRTWDVVANELEGFLEKRLRQETSDS